MTRSELVKEVQSRTGMTRNDADTAVKSVFDIITETLTEGNEVAIKGFGTFSVQVRPERQGRNPATKEAITIPEKKIAKLKFSSEVKKLVNG